MKQVIFKVFAMKFLCALLILCGIGVTGKAQIVALSPTGDGGFETGTTFTSSGWTVVNPASLANQWIMGNIPGPYSGANCAYVSNNGSAYAYTTTVSKTCHFYRNIVIPAGSVSITLSFQWKGFGELATDQMLVYTAPTTVTPIANNPASPSTALAGATLVWSQPDASTGSFAAATIPLPATLAGTTVRLIFTWQNNPTAGVTPGAAIDNISLTYNCTSPAAITGTSTVCVGATTNLADASPSGAWSSSNFAVGTVSSSGVVTGVSEGTTTISYTTTCLSPATAVVSVFAAPTAITGSPTICLGSTTALGETSGGGTWSSTVPSVAPVNAAGVVTGNALGTSVISYANGCGTAVGLTVTVVPAIPAITGTATHVCAAGDTITFSDAVTGGTWSASPAANATAMSSGPGTGIVIGHLGGTAIVTYTAPSGCIATRVITVDPVPAPIAGVVPICTLGSATLTDALPGGSWSSSVTGVATIGSSTGIVSGVTGGTTIISYINGNGCGYSTAVFTVNPYPVLIVGHDSLCIGGTTALADATIGGSWSSSNPAVASILPASGVTTALAIGTTLITYSMPGGCNTYRQVAVLSLPPAIAGTMEMCPGASTTLSNAIIGGTWGSANNIIATVGSGSGIVTGVTADTVHIIYTTHYGCQVFAVVTVNPLPDTIVSRTVFCIYRADTLFDAATGGSWFSTTTGTATIDAVTGIVAPLSTGTATFKYTLPTGCSITKSIEIKPLPTPSIAFNNATNMLFTDSGYVTYQWYHTTLGLIVGATTRKTPGLHNGSYYVLVTDTNGCPGASSNFAYTLSMGVAAIGETSGLNIYPNPSSDKIFVSGSYKVTIMISTIEGKTAIRLENASEADIKTLPAGVYIVTLYNKEGVSLAVRKLVKQ
jgi:hypothetical protein